MAITLDVQFENAIAAFLSADPRDSRSRLQELEDLVIENHQDITAALKLLKRSRQAE